MKIASAAYKDIVTEILVQSFQKNKSVAYILKDTSLKELKVLMEYSFDMCLSFGKVLLSDDFRACALVCFPDKKKITFRRLLLELKFIAKGIGLRNIQKVLRRESLIKAHYPKHEIYYLWFIGVSPAFQGKGLGSLLLKEIIKDAENTDRSIYLETSSFRNLSFYRRHGLHVYAQLDFGYDLYLIQRGFGKSKDELSIPIK